jgi:hypothetical protein
MLEKKGACMYVDIAFWQAEGKYVASRQATGFAMMHTGPWTGISCKILAINFCKKAFVVVVALFKFCLNEQLNLHDALTEARDKKK